MPTTGNPQTHCWRGLLVALVLVLPTATAHAQQNPVLTPPTPIDSPLVAPGPAPNPFGPAPMAIGTPVLPYSGPQPFLLPPNRPPLAYPPSPYVFRQPTPFEGRPAPYYGSPYQSRSPFYERNQPVASRQPMSRQIPPTVGVDPYATYYQNPSPVQRPVPVEAVTPAAIGNLRLTVSEAFLNRLIARDEDRPGEVRDFILGAQVSGRQQTATQLRFDLLPSADQIHGALVLNGVTQSQTTGVTPQAMVDVASRQNFAAYKELYFDGTRLTTRHAVVRVQARNQTMGATTPFSGTLFGGLADRIAYRAAERRQPEAEAVARDRVAERVYPEFDTEIDKQLAAANDTLELTVRPLLKKIDLMPTEQRAWSTDRLLGYSAQLAAESPMTSTTGVESRLSKEAGVSLLIHESLLKLAIDRSGLKGLKTTDKEIRKHLAPYEFKPTGDELEQSEPPINLPGMDNLVTEIEFDDVDPLSIRLEQDRTVVTIRASFKPGGQDVLPPLAVSIEYRTELVGDKVVVIPGKVSVAPQKSDDGNGSSGVAMTLISKAIESSLLKLGFDRALPSSLWKFAGPAPRVVDIRSQEGWAGIAID